MREPIEAALLRICGALDVAPKAVIGHSRGDDRLQLARDMVCFEARQAGHTLQAIGRVMGRHHSSVRDAVAREATRRGVALVYRPRSVCQYRQAGRV